MASVSRRDAPKIDDNVQLTFDQPKSPTMDTTAFNIVEASIEDHRQALESGSLTSVELVVSYLRRIAAYDIQAGLNAFTVFNPRVLEEAQASDEWRATGKSPRPLEGVPYTLKDSYKYKGMTVTNGSPALKGLMSNEDSHIASTLRAAGAVLIGKTNMPPMAAGGMQRGMYGRAESPYNRDYLTAAYSSGSSNGAATSTATSMAVFAMGSETVSSGRSPASNNALVVYTPSKGVLSCRGLWPLYVTCDVPTPMTRSVKDLHELLAVISEEDPQTYGDFWRSQQHVQIPKPPRPDYYSLAQKDVLKGKRIAVPKMYMGESDSHPNPKPTVVHPSVINLWHRARQDLEALGAEVIPTDFPLVTNYEDDSVSGQANNIQGAPDDWSAAERAMVIAKTWEDFLASNADPKTSSLKDVDCNMLFPKPPNYVPDTFVEVKNIVDYPNLPAIVEKYRDTSLYDLPGMAQAVKALEAQRKRDFEDWLETNGFDLVVFPAQGDVGRADLEFNFDSSKHALQNGVKYSNGNRAIRHLGVPTVSVPMGVMEGSGMPVNLTFAGKAGEDEMLLSYAYAFEQGSKRRVMPKLTPALESDVCGGGKRAGKDVKKIGLEAETTVSKEGGNTKLKVSGSIVEGVEVANVEVYIDGESVTAHKTEDGKWEAVTDYVSRQAERLDWSLKPLPPRPAMVLVVARLNAGGCVAKLLWVKTQ